MKRALLAAAVVAMALSLSSIAALQPVVHAEGIASDAKSAAKETGKSVEGAVSETKETAKGKGKSLMETAGKVKTDAGKTRDSAQALDLQGTAQGAGDTKQGVRELHEGAKETMKNPFGK